MKRLNEFTKNIVENLHFSIWYMRSAIVHQLSLTGRTGTLFNELTNHIYNIEILIENERMSNALMLNILIEIVNIFIQHDSHKNAQKYLLLASQYSRIVSNLSDLLNIPDNSSKITLTFPVHLKEIKEDKEKLIDEILNNSKEELEFLPEYTEKDPANNESFMLNSNEQALLLTYIKYIRKFQIFEDQTQGEEWLPYFNLLLYYSNEWIIQFNLLKMRILDQVECNELLEQSLKQIENLSTLGSEFTNLEISVGRLRYFYSVLSVPFWTIMGHRAVILENTDKEKALKEYIKLNNWKKIVSCYEKSNVEKLIEEKLKINNNQPYLHCALGIITNNVKLYKYSLEISNNRYILAKNLLGLHYFNKQEFDVALEYFQDSVNINNFQKDIWYLIGNSYLSIEEWESAEFAFENVLQYDFCSIKLQKILSNIYFKNGKYSEATETLESVINFYHDELQIYESFFRNCEQLAKFKKIQYNWTHLAICKQHWILESIKDYLKLTTEMNERINEFV